MHVMRGRRTHASPCSSYVPNTGSGNVAVSSIERVAEHPAVECREHLRDAGWDRHFGLKSEFAADALEADLVISRVLVPVDKGDLATGRMFANLFNDVEFAVVLGGVTGIEDPTGDFFARGY